MTDYNLNYKETIYLFIYLFENLLKVEQLIITIRIDCIRELKKDAPKIWKAPVITSKLYTN